jgi:hypothetical protein
MKQYSIKLIGNLTCRLDNLLKDLYIFNTCKNPIISVCIISINNLLNRKWLLHTSRHYCKLLVSSKFCVCLLTPEWMLGTCRHWQDWCVVLHPLQNISLMIYKCKTSHIHTCIWWRALKFIMHGAYGLWTGRDLYCVTLMFLQSHSKVGVKQYTAVFVLSGLKCPVCFVQNA